MTAAVSRGVVFVHSCPRALCAHVEWAINSVLSYQLHLEWTEQQAAPGMLRAEVAWEGPAGTGAQLASALRGWQHLRYEITEDASPGVDGGRWSHTPDLGIFYAQTDMQGDVVVSENRIRAALLQPSPAAVQEALRLALGMAWDEELEPFRFAGEGAAVRWLHRVG